MVAVEIHRYPAVAGTLDVHGKTAGSIMSPLTENEKRRSILGYKQRCMPAWLDKAALHDAYRERPRWVDFDLWSNRLSMAK
jgi:hypothetical protein